MLLLNTHTRHNDALDMEDAEVLGSDAAKKAARFLSFRADHRITPLHSLSGLAKKAGVSAIHIKDESERLGMNSFKALGGSYAVICLVLEEAARKLGIPVDISELQSPAVREIASRMTFGCATDGNHGKSVAAGAKMVGAKAAIFVHSGVSEERVAAIAEYGATMIRVDGTYDDSVAEAQRKCADMGWTVVSDTSWPGYERIPSLVMQGYTAMLKEVVASLPETPTHVFIQAGVGGLAAAVAGFFDIFYGEDRPQFITVEPDRAACIFASAEADDLIKVDSTEPTIMAMLECYEPSLVAWRILTRKADAFMTITEEDAAETMRQLARPVDNDPPIISGESGAAGLAGLLAAVRDPDMRSTLGIDETSRIFVINTEGATDKGRYEKIVGMTAEEVKRVG
ncbi:diaminopropionate ammonia-lyase [Pseudohoeflea suaedae]|uniref:Diaminopropionate ammonia-lyase n=1 Tax=Pseudohoeflea suaedae TaxID=877384 RepID=A0A4R5PJ34_9HYPH|nr:diaminopropionate ammonia-lyase [Pseudohoeflea suaedae]TDH35181.1 diaminopropionate ammonia-lyase [Pseudohoeflea suaedae]